MFTDTLSNIYTAFFLMAGYIGLANLVINKFRSFITKRIMWWLIILAAIAGGVISSQLFSGFSIETLKRSDSITFIVSCISGFAVGAIAGAIVYELSLVMFTAKGNEPADE